jgi:hypothetical protein
MDENLVDEYMDFFRSNYIQRNQTPDGSSASSNTAQPVVSETVSQPEIEQQEEPVEVESAYNNNVDGTHLFVFVVPLEGIDKTIFVNGIQQYNSTNYGSLQLKMEEKPLDNFRQIIAVEGFPDKETALKYSANLVQNRDLYKPLGDANYRNFLISTENLDVFLSEKNIVEYMDFYKRIYLNQ